MHVMKDPQRKCITFLGLTPPNPFAAARIAYRRPPMAFRGRTGYNIRPERRSGYWAVDAGVGWGTERWTRPEPPPSGDHASGIRHGRRRFVGRHRTLNVRGKKIKEHKRILNSIN